MVRGSVAVGLGLVLVLSSIAPATSAQPEPGSDAALQEAKSHFDRALGHYKAGEYKRAVSELQSAIALDPTGKDLVYNLALVYEKMGELELAISSFRRFLEMETDAAEREKVEATLRRLEGAQQEVEPEDEESSTGRAGAASPQSSPTEPAEPTRGKLDGWVWATGSASVAALALGTVFAVRAMSKEPRAATGLNRSFEDVQSRQEDAHRNAVAADVLFAVGIASGATAVGLYVFRDEEAPGSASARRFVGASVGGAF